MRSTVSPPRPQEPRRINAGVIGVGAMGENHARIYSELQDISLVGVSDLDTDRANRIAEAYGTSVFEQTNLLKETDIVSVCVPTAGHFETVAECINRGVDVLVEKPIANSIDRANEMARMADEQGVVLQVGHIERFNPAIGIVSDVIDDLDIIAIDAERLGPPIDRTETDSVTIDLMIHDIDIVQSLLADEPHSVEGAGLEDGSYAMATLRFPNDVIVSLTASRITRRKVRRLRITARECLVEIDYLDQSVLIYRNTFPEFVTDEGYDRLRHESVIERPQVPRAEPLRMEIEAFIESARNGSTPEVTPREAIRALETARSIEQRIATMTDSPLATK